jgi:SAM-dependent methyltransferase
MNERLRSEQVFHDAQAAERRRAWAADPSQLQFASEQYLDHEPWIRPALAKLGPLPGKRMLDFGCGHGMAATVLARLGAEVVAFDLSAGYVDEAVCRAHANGVTLHGVIADGTKLPFRDRSFDAIWGVAILHHLALDQTAREIHRVLRPGGVAVFCEPWGGNPALHVARRWLPYVGKERTRDEAPLSARDVEVLHTEFPDVEFEPVQLAGMIRRAWRGCPLLPALDRLDQSLLRRLPILGRWCRYLVITLRTYK